jgi:hypothetical protein
MSDPPPGVLSGTPPLSIVAVAKRVHMALGHADGGQIRVFA